MADPLVLLREYNLNKKDITESDSEIIFGDTSWPKNTKTSCVQSSKKSENTEYYTLECLLFFLKNHHLNHPDYCRLAEEEKIPAVFRPDRKKILAYLNGETETISDKVAGSKIPIQVKRTSDTDGKNSTGKKKLRK